MTKNGESESNTLQLLKRIDELEKKLSKLREKEDEFEQVLAKTPAIVYSCATGPNRPTIFISESIVSRFGYHPHELYADPLFLENLIHTEDIDEFREKWSSVQRDKSVCCEYRLRNKEGNYIWVLDEFSLIKNKDRGADSIIGSLFIINDRILAEQALATSEKRLELALEGAEIALWDQNFITNEVYRSKRWAKMLGYKPEEVGASLQLWKDLIHPDDLPLTMKMVSDHEKGRDPVFRLEHRMKTKSGGWKWILNWGKIVDRDQDGKPLRAAGIHLDITEQKRAERRLSESQERIRAIFESASDSIFMKNIDHQYVSVNPALEKLIDIPASQIIGKNDIELYGSEVGELLMKTDLQVFRGNIFEEESDKLINGKNICFHVVKVPMRNQQGEIIGLCGIARDVTETERLREFAIRAQRLEIAGRIAGQVAHDFNNLLGPLTAYPELIRDELPDNHPALEYVDYMEMAAHQMSEINQQLLTLGRRGHYNQEIININDIIKKAVQQTIPVPKTLAIEEDLADDLMNIKGGGSQIFRAISNLISNARDSMIDVGRITIRTENFYADKVCGKVDRIPRGEYVKLTISDTGAGMSPEVMAKIFDPFFTTKTSDKKRGSGLGLSIVHAVVEDHNGFIDCISKEGVATSIYTYFPSTRDHIDHESHQVLGGSEKVLVVDDDQVQRDVAHKLLNKLGYDVSTVVSGEEAIKQIRNIPHDLIILDMIMPGGIDGTETLERILDINPSQKAIIVSGFAETDRVSEALKLGAGAFIKKPLTLKTIAQGVRDELDKKM